MSNLFENNEIPAESVKAVKEQYAKVEQLVLQAMRIQDTATYHGDSNEGAEAAPGIAKQIMDVFYPG